MRKTDPYLEEQIRKLYDEGFCDQDIAERFGKRKEVVGNWRRKRKKGLNVSCPILEACTLQYYRVDSRLPKDLPRWKRQYRSPSSQAPSSLR